MAILGPPFPCRRAVPPLFLSKSFICVTLCDDAIIVDDWCLFIVSNDCCVFDAAYAALPEVLRGGRSIHVDAAYAAAAPDPDCMLNSRLFWDKGITCRLECLNGADSVLSGDWSVRFVFLVTWCDLACGLVEIRPEEESCCCEIEARRRKTLRKSGPDIESCDIAFIKLNCMSVYRLLVTIEVQLNVWRFSLTLVASRWRISGSLQITTSWCGISSVLFFCGEVRHCSVYCIEVPSEYDHLVEVRGPSPSGSEELSRTCWWLLRKPVTLNIEYYC